MLQKLNYKLIDEDREKNVITTAGDTIRTDRKYGAVKFLYGDVIDENGVTSTEVINVDESEVSFIERCAYLVYCALNRKGAIQGKLSDEGFETFLNDLEFVRSVSMDEDEVEEEVLNPTVVPLNPQS